MVGEYKRPTKIVELPSGKKVEIVEYFSNWDFEEIQKVMATSLKVDPTKMDANFFNGAMIPAGDAIDAFRKAKELSVKKLIDVDGKEYQATAESVRDFITGEDSEVFDKEISALMAAKKKLTGKDS